jgi:hypothetical protein
VCACVHVPNSPKHAQNAHRCLFGGESVSLRFINNLDDRLDAVIGSKHGTGSPSDLVDLLLSKVPTISQTTAEDFVACFLTASEAVRSHQDPISAVASQRTGPVSLMVQAALCTELCAKGIDFPDFVSSATGLRRAYDGPPALRIAAWCCHMRAAAGNSDRCTNMARPESIFHPVLVDQYGFPLQLKEHVAGLFLSEGLAFSWNGDYSRITDIIDAVGFLLCLLHWCMSCSPTCRVSHGLLSLLVMTSARRLLAALVSLDMLPTFWSCTCNFLELLDPSVTLLRGVTSKKLEQ